MNVTYSTSEIQISTIVRA